MQYICLVYMAPNVMDTLSSDEFYQHARKCVGWVGDLEKSGRHVYSSGLQSPKTAVTLRTRNGSISTTDGPFAETKEVLGGFTILEARDMNEAIQLASKLDAVKYGVIEVRPLFDPSTEMSDPDDAKKAVVIKTAIEALDTVE